MDDGLSDEMIHFMRDEYMGICKDLHKKYVLDDTINPIARYLAFTIMQSISRKMLLKDPRITPKVLMTLEGVAQVLIQMSPDMAKMQWPDDKDEQKGKGKGEV